MTYKTAGGYEIFVDNNMVGTHGTQGGSIAYSDGTSTNRIGVGCREDEWHNGFRGDIAQVRIYTRALTNEELQHNYEVDRAKFGKSKHAPPPSPSAPPSAPPPNFVTFSTSTFTGSDQLGSSGSTRFILPAQHYIESVATYSAPLTIQWTMCGNHQYSGRMKVSLFYDASDEANVPSFGWNANNWYWPGGSGGCTSECCGHCAKNMRVEVDSSGAFKIYGSPANYFENTVAFNNPLVQVPQATGTVGRTTGRLRIFNDYHNTYTCCTYPRGLAVYNFLINP